MCEDSEMFILWARQVPSNLLKEGMIIYIWKWHVFIERSQGNKIIIAFRGLDAVHLLRKRKKSEASPLTGCVGYWEHNTIEVALLGRNNDAWSAHCGGGGRRGRLPGFAFPPTHCHGCIYQDNSTMLPVSAPQHPTPWWETEAWKDSGERSSGVIWGFLWRCLRAAVCLVCSTLGLCSELD